MMPFVGLTIRMRLNSAFLPRTTACQTSSSVNCRQPKGFDTTKMDNEWELEEGIPQVEDPFIQQYLNGRNSLIDQEQKQRHGWRSIQLLLCSSIPFAWTLIVF